MKKENNLYDEPTTKSKEEKTTKNQNKKVKIIDYGKLKESEKKLKNKLGIEKIKVVYFD